MTLSEQDKEYLRRIGENDRAIGQIEWAISSTTFEYKGKRISCKKALELLTREQFLSGMDRSAFHWNATRYTNDGEAVHFDSSRFFRS